MEQLQVNAAAFEHLRLVFSENEVPENEVGDTITHIAREYKKRYKVGIVNLDKLKPLIANLQVATPHETFSAENDETNSDFDIDYYNFFNIIGAQDTPRMEYSQINQNFLCIGKARKVIGEEDYRPKLFKARYELLLQRILRHSLFTCSWNVKTSQRYKLSFIKDLRGKKREPHLLFGMLTLTCDKYYLEDSEDKIELNISNATIPNRILVPNCFLVVQGFFNDEDEIFEASYLAHPPVEKRAVTRNAFRNIDFLGCTKIFENEFILQPYVEKCHHMMFLVFSDVYLNQDQTFEKLDTIFSAYSKKDVIPFAVILIGNFWSEQVNGEDEDYADGFSSLGDLIAMYPKLAIHTNFVFVPGPRDPYLRGVFPHFPIPDIYTSGLRKRVKRAFFTTNPCRLQFLTQEIVIYRNDIMEKFHRNLLLECRTDEKQYQPDEVIKTLIAQGHLSPFPLSVCPIHWEFDHTLRLYPLPHTLILADRGPQFQFTYEDCLTFNPGSFNSGTTHQWMNYYPSKIKAQFCESSAFEKPTPSLDSSGRKMGNNKAP
ncbi:hypothetical protein G9A89_007708 [Geosiphon pyriformis]|nr:hypothetical protein G9A89_007708 [Geosiphon pyriformis]